MRWLFYWKNVSIPYYHAILVLQMSDRGEA